MKQYLLLIHSRIALSNWSASLEHTTGFLFSHKNWISSFWFDLLVLSIQQAFTLAYLRLRLMNLPSDSVDLCGAYHKVLPYPFRMGWLFRALLTCSKRATGFCRKIKSTYMESLETCIIFSHFSFEKVYFALIANHIAKLTASHYQGLGADSYGPFTVLFDKILDIQNLFSFQH